MAYNNQLTMEQLFRNPKLNRVLPQFNRKTPLQNVYSGAEITSRVQRYIVGAIGGTVTGEGEIRVKGKQREVLSRVKQLQPLLEAMFNNTPSLIKNIRNNTKVYTEYASIGQIEGIKGETKGIRGKAYINEKIELLQDVLANINFNPDFNSMNSITNLPPREFTKQQAAWFKKVQWKGRQ